MILDDIRIVLVNTSHSGNIGSAARAMKTMGLSKLYLVDPACEIDSQASALAAGATDVLGNAVIVGTVERLAQVRVLVRFRGQWLNHVNVVKNSLLKL